MPEQREDLIAVVYAIFHRLVKIKQMLTLAKFKNESASFAFQGFYFHSFFLLQDYSILALPFQLH